MSDLVLGLKRNIKKFSFKRQYNSPPQINPLLQPRSIPRQHVSMFSSVRRPSAQLQFGGTPGCGCGK